VIGLSSLDIEVSPHQSSFSQDILKIELSGPHYISSYGDVVIISPIFSHRTHRPGIGYSSRNRHSAAAMLVERRT
jgi:hypothetical protein